MGIEDRDWYREDYERRRKQIEKDEKSEQRRRRQMGADAMWNEVEPSKKTLGGNGNSPPKWANVNRRKVVSALKKIPGYKKILANCTFKDQEDSVYFDYVLIHEAGLFAFQLCEDYRVIRGESRAKYWTVEDYTSLGYPRYQERPTVQLEKDHAILDRIIRRYTHVKSFAYLIFPNSGGLENLSGDRNHMTTERSLYAVLKSDIQHYGNAFSKAEIDQLYAVVRDALSPNPTPYQTPIDFPKTPKKRKQGSPVWMHLVQVLGALAVLAVVVLVIANTEWGSNFLKDKNIQLPSIHLPPAKEQAAKPTEVARANPTTNTALIPSYLVYDGSSQAEYDHFAEEYGMTSVKRGADGSLTMSSETNLLHANVDALVATLVKKSGTSGYMHFASISVNDDHTVFTIVMDDNVMYEQERQAVTDLFLMAGLEAVQTGQNVQNIRVETVTKQGKLLSERNTNPDPNAVIRPTQATPATPTSQPVTEPMAITSSRMVKEPSYEGTCPFKVTLPTGDKDYYIYLKYLHPSEKSITDRNMISNDNMDDVSIYIKADETFSCKVPVGVYQLYCTFGDTWHGTEERFGTGAPMYRFEDLLEFYNDGKQWMGNSVELQPVRDGNFERTQIFGSEFPS